MFNEQGYIVSPAWNAPSRINLQQKAQPLQISSVFWSGCAFLRQAGISHPQLPFILVTAHGSVDTAVAAMKEGADDYLLKPLHWDELLVVVERLQQPGSTPGEPASDRISLHFNFSPEEFSLDAIDRQVIEWALEKCDNNKSSAARLLKASRKLFY